MTFLFTDVEDSSVLWERFPRSMANALARHDTILRDVIGRRDGHVFTASGDGFGAAFASAPGAVAAAVDAQRALGSEPWPGDIAVRVRMGLHSGTATERDGNYFGSVVNRAARVSAIGRGGHILLSAVTAELVVDEGWALVDLGRCNLKGLGRPERVFRLDAPGLPVVELPLRVRPERAGNLPSPSARLLGREEAVRRVVEFLAAHRLVTVMGPGGVGKTRLAIAAAHAVEGGFPDGTWLLELGELQEAADVPSAVLTTLGVQPMLGTDGAPSTVAALADQRALLVLDNCEHLIAGVVRLVGELEARCEQVVVLATSREALGVGHEVRFNLQPLDLDSRDGAGAARELFCDRAASVLGGFQPSETDLAIVDEICRRLDGLPLAIELATARLSAMTLTELLGHLDHRFDVLAGRRGVDARQQSLWATVTWSYELLTVAERSFFDRLSVFGADFDADAAAAVAGDGTMPADDLLMSLVDKSLLIATRGPLGTRFRELETLRQYGAGRLGEDATTTSMRRQLDYYVAWTEAADAGVKGEDELRWHQRLTAEWPNIRNVLRWACDVDQGDAACKLVGRLLWWTTSRMRLETEQWCALALASPSASDHRLRPALLAGEALFAHMRNDRVREPQSLALARAEEERLGPAPEPWVQLAVLNQWSGGPAAALGDVESLRRRADAVGDRIWQIRASLDEALILATLVQGERISAGEVPHSIARIREVVEQAEEFGQPSSITSAWTSLAISLRRSQPAEALSLLERALDLSTPLDVEEISNTARRELASHYAQLGRPLDALALMGPALAAYLRAGARHEVTESLAYVVRALADAGCPRVATTVLGCVGVDLDDPGQLEYIYHDVPDLHAELVAVLGSVDFQARLADGASRQVGDVAQLVVETIAQLDLTSKAGQL